MNRTLAQTKGELKKRGLTYDRVAIEVRRLFPDRTCSRQMVTHVLAGRAKSVYVNVAIERLLEKAHALSA